jgi:hypothetical protein
VESGREHGRRVWIFALTALLIRGVLSDRIGRPISAFTIFCALTIISWPAALLGTALLLRLEPYVEIPVWRKRTTVKALAVGAALLVIPAVHSTLHPLWSDPISIAQPQSKNLATVPVENAGFAGVELRSVVLRTPVPIAELVDVRADRHPPFSPGGPFASPRLPYTVGGGDPAFIQLRLRHRGCGTVRSPRPRWFAIGFRGNLRSQALPVKLTPRPCS